MKEHEDVVAETLPNSAQLTPEEKEMLKRWHKAYQYDHIVTQDAYVHEDEVYE